MVLVRFAIGLLFIASLIGCASEHGGIPDATFARAPLRTKAVPVLTVTKYGLPNVRSLCFSMLRGWYACSVNAGPHGITKGNDGALWFTQLVYSCVTAVRPPKCSGAIGRITTNGSMIRYALKNQARPWAIVNGPDGALWFTEQTSNKIGRISLAGTITEYAIPSTSSSPVGIVTGSDRALWFLLNGLTSRVARISTGGNITEYVIPTANSNPFEIVSGSDGALWFGEYGSSKIGRITTTGKITEYPTPTKASGPYSVARGADGAVWFTETFANKVGRIATNGKITEYPAGAMRGFNLIANGPQGRLWFTERPLNLATIATTGKVSQYYLSGDVFDTGITTGPDDALWLSDDDSAGSAIARVVP